MTFDDIEKLKREWTDQYVMVDEDVPELRRFAGRTGIVKTVNMSGRALVEFQYRASTIAYPDISWYDIDPSYLRVVEKPAESEKTAAPAEKPAAKEAKSAPAKKPAAAKAGGKKKSPLERAREQDAAKAQSGAATASAAKEDTAGKKLSPLERARREGAAKQGDAPSQQPQDAKAESTESAEEKPEPKKPAGKKLSPLERARQEGAAKRDKDEG